MPKPSSIKIAQILLYLKLLLIIFLMFSVLSVVPAVLNILFIAAGLFAIYKRRRMLSFIFTLLILYFSPDIINMVLSFGVVVLLFTRSSRLYFAGEMMAPSPAQEAGDSIDAEGYTVEESAPSEASDSDEPSTEELSLPLAEADKAVDAPAQAASANSAASAAASPNAPSSAPQPAAKPSANPVVEIREAEAEDAAIVHGIMLEAFEEFRAAVPPSSALFETVESVREALELKSEEAAILTEDGIPAAIVRFRYEDNAIYFFRLSVRPARRKRGYARQLIEWIELRGRSKGLEICRCKVRQSVSRNLVLYENMGYEITNQELVVRPEGSVKTLTMEKRLMNY